MKLPFSFNTDYVLAAFVLSTCILTTSNLQAAQPHKLNKPHAHVSTNQFFIKGQCYLFTTTTMPTWNAGKITKLTAHEIVFADVKRVYLQEFVQKKEITSSNLHQQTQILQDYVSGKNMNFIEKSPFAEISYSRSNIAAALKVNKCE